MQKLLGPRERLHDVWEIAVTAFMGMSVSFLDKTESPIEQLLGLSIRHLIDANRDGFEDIVLDLVPQKEISLDGSNYRLDFLIRTYDFKNKTELFFVVECDGHQFHEKTKKQAQHDKERDRILTKHGYRVLRFTGSEIVKDPIKCGYEVITAVWDLLKKVGD